MSPLRLCGIVLLLAAVAVADAWAEKLAPLPAPNFAAQPLPVLPQNDVLSADLGTIYRQKEDIDQGLVVVELGQGEDNPRWMMSPTQLQVFLDTVLQFMPEKPVPEDAIWPKLGRRDPAYRGVRIVLHTIYGQHFEPFTVFEGKLVSANGTMLVPDYGRRLEYWMFGTSRVRRDQMVGAHVMPVMTFEQCRLLGQPIVETRPKQCLLPDNNLVLESNEMPTLKAARIRDFDGCLQDGKALIYTFPRRCMAMGGRVFTEPPKVYEAPADAPLAASGPLSLPVSATSLDGLGTQLDLSNELGGAVMQTPAGGL